MAAFPTYARLLLDGYGQTPDYGVLRSQMDNSLAKQRPTRSLPVVTRDATLMVESLADQLAFDEWFGTDLSGGTGWFDFRALDGKVKPARIVNGDIRWNSPGGGIWLAQVKIETLG